MGKRGQALPREVYWQARQMYEEKDARGRRLYSMREVAAKLGISEMSVLRAVTNTGRFANINEAPLPPTRTEEMWKEEAAASLKRTLELLAEPEKQRADPLELLRAHSARPDEAPIARTPPPSPLDGGDAPDETGGAGVTKLVEINTVGDQMLDELKANQGEKK